jgi:putative ABC transport system permease protein
VAAALIGAGVACLALSNRDAPPLIVAGLLGTILGALLLGPVAIRVFSAVAGRLPVAPRLALRDLVRYQARSGAALAAVTVALGIATSVVVVFSAEEAKRASAPPTLSAWQLRVFLGPKDDREALPVDARGRLVDLAVRVRRLARDLGSATVIPLSKAFQPGTPSEVVGATTVLPSVVLAQRSGGRYLSESQLYVATPSVLAYLGIDPGAIAPDTDFLADRDTRTAGLVVPNPAAQDIILAPFQRIDVGHHLFGTDGGRPPIFITLNGLRRHGWTQIPAGWLVGAHRTLTHDQIAHARDITAKAGLTVGVRRETTSYAKVKLITALAGAFLALGILALMVGLIRGERAGDLRTLTATGAGPSVRRTITAATAGALALLGASVGVAGAYVVLGALYHDDLGYLRHTPIPYLALAVVGVPAAAASAGWLLAGREPPAIARQVIE